MLLLLLFTIILISKMAIARFCPCCFQRLLFVLFLPFGLKRWSIINKLFCSPQTSSWSLAWYFLFWDGILDDITILGDEIGPNQVFLSQLKITIDFHPKISFQNIEPKDMNKSINSTSVIIFTELPNLPC